MSPSAGGRKRRFRSIEVPNTSVPSKTDAGSRISAVSKMITAGGLAAAVVVGGLATTATSALAATSRAASSERPATTINGVARIAGATRIDTAIATSQDAFPGAGSARAVVLARSDAFPDALAGGPLAANKGGPLLLISATGVDASVQTELKRALPAGATVYIMGGAKALSTSVDSTITGLGYIATRVSGADRYATAVAAADQMGDPSTVFEASGLAFPDALSAGPAAIKSGGVILLTNGKQQAAATATYLAAHATTRYAVGGPAAAADPSATAIVGPDRYWTASEVAAEFFEDATVVGAASGLNFPDALAAGPDLAAKGAPLLLVPTSGGLPNGVLAALFGLAATVQSGVVFGGTASVTDDVATQIGNLATAPARAAAADSSAAFNGAFGVSVGSVSDTTATVNETEVTDASTGDTTVYLEGGGSQTVSADYAPRAQLAALPTDLVDFVSAVNALYASFDTSHGIDPSTTDPDALYTINAAQIVLNPVAPPSIRYRAYAALAAADGATDIAANVKDTLGRPGIEIFANTGATPADHSKLSFFFDPITLLPLEQVVFDAAGNVSLRHPITSMTTVATAPGDPYSS